MRLFGCLNEEKSFEVMIFGSAVTSEISQRINEYRKGEVAVWHCLLHRTCHINQMLPVQNLFCVTESNLIPKKLIVKETKIRMCETITIKLGSGLF